MGPLIDEHVETVGREVRELARLHVDLARTELRNAGISLLVALFAIGFGVAAGLLTLVALGVAFGLLLAPALGGSGAAAVVAAAYTAIGGIAVWRGGRALRGLGSLALPRTRAMIGELFAWRGTSNES